jgi:hypothetical protein
VRGVSAIADLNLNGKNWGNSTTTASQTTITAVGITGAAQVTGSGNAGQLIGVNGVVQVTPASGSANVAYATGSYSVIDYSSGPGYAASTLANARLFSGALSSVSGNLTVTNAIGLHVMNGWATGATNKYVVWNEDSGSTILTNGPITSTGTVNFTNANVTLGAFHETVYAQGSTSGTLTFNLTNGSIQSLTATAGVTISNTSFTNMTAGSSLTVIITQGGSGSNALTTSGILYAGGNNTLSTTYGLIDIINYFYDGTNYYGSIVKGYQ